MIDSWWARSPTGHVAAVLPRSDEVAAVLDDLVGAEQERFGDGQPKDLAVVRLTTRSNFVGCSTGRSAGFAPWL
jgi:hypothetical protein